MPPAWVDLIVTPYDNLRTYASPSSISHLLDFFGIAWLMKRALKPGGVLVWVVADETVIVRDGSGGGAETWNKPRTFNASACACTIR